MSNKRCEMCDEALCDIEAKVPEEKKSVVRQLALANNWEACYQPNLMQKLGKDIMTRILDFCDPGDLMSVGLVNRWCQLLSTRPELWKDLFKRDYMHFLDNVPEGKRRYEASNLLTSIIASNKQSLRDGWEKSGKDVYLSIVWGLNARLDAREIEIHETMLERQQMTHEDRMDNWVDMVWPVLTVGLVLFVLTLCLLIVKLVYPDSLTWTDTIAPLASAFVLHSLYTILGGIYGLAATCLHRKAFCNCDWLGPGAFLLGWISIPWGAFLVLLILEIEGAIHWTYSYIFISLYLAVFLVLVFWNVWIYRQDDRSVCAVFVLYCVCCLLCALLFVCFVCALVFYCLCCLCSVALLFCVACSLCLCAVMLNSKALTNSTCSGVRPLW